jgi:hypothetical protein
MGQKGDIPVRGVVALVTGATAAIDASLGNVFTFTFPAGNATFTLSNVKPGHSIDVIVTQDGGGGRTITWAGQTLNAFTATNKTTPAAGAAAVTVFHIVGSAVNMGTADVVNKFAQ